MHGKPVRVRRCPRNGKRVRQSRPTPLWPPRPREGGWWRCSQARRPVRSRRGRAASALQSKTCGLRGRSLLDRGLSTMKASCLAGLASLASLGVQAQTPPFIASQATFEPVVVTASRGLNPAATLRDAVVIQREDLEAAGPLSLAEVLQRRAGVEVRATGGPGQPQGLFIRGAGSAQAPGL